MLGSLQENENNDGIDTSGAGEWWNKDVEAVVNQGSSMGVPPNMSDAHTINGKPGPLFPCSEKRKRCYLETAFDTQFQGTEH